MRDKSSHLRELVKHREINVKSCILSKVAKANLSNNNLKCCFSKCSLRFVGALPKILCAAFIACLAVREFAGEFKPNFLCAHEIPRMTEANEDFAELVFKR